jgi:hypothetical protein
MDFLMAISHGGTVPVPPVLMVEAHAPNLKKVFVFQIGNYWP